jgi:hypothetical protein
MVTRIGPTVRLPPARTSWASSGRSWRACPCWLTPGTRVQASALMSRRKPAGVRELDINTHTPNALIRSARCLSEPGLALLTQRWRTLQHVTASGCAACHSGLLHQRLA